MAALDFFRETLAIGRLLTGFYLELRSKGSDETGRGAAAQLISNSAIRTSGNAAMIFRWSARKIECVTGFSIRANAPSDMNISADFDLGTAETIIIRVLGDSALMARKAPSASIPFSVDMMMSRVTISGRDR